MEPGVPEISPWTPIKKRPQGQAISTKYILCVKYAGIHARIRNATS
jgi:hypothetical protein